MGYSESESSRQCSDWLDFSGRQMRQVGPFTKWQWISVFKPAISVKEDKQAVTDGAATQDSS